MIWKIFILLFIYQIDHSRCFRKDPKVTEDDKLTSVLRLNMKKLSTPIYVGYPPQFAFLNLDLKGQYPIVSGFHYKLGISKTTSSVSKAFIDYDNITLHSDLVRDEFAFHETESIIKDFNFYLADVSLDFPINLPLSYKMENPDFNLVHLFKKNGLIQQSVFYILLEDESGGYFNIGENLPRTLSNRVSKKSGECNVNKNLNDWNCYFQGIKVNNKTFEANEYTIFSTTENKILVPEAFINFLNKTLFRKYIESNACDYNEYSVTPPTTKYFSCRCHLINDTFPNVTFFLGDYGYQFTYKELFYRVHNFCGFYIQNVEDVKDSYVFGLSFLSQFGTKFDYEKNSITFYSEKVDILDLSNHKKKVLMLSTLISIFSIIMSITLIVIYVRNMKV